MHPHHRHARLGSWRSCPSCSTCRTCRYALASDPWEEKSVMECIWHLPYRNCMPGQIERFTGRTHMHHGVWTTLVMAYWDSNAKLWLWAMEVNTLLQLTLTDPTAIILSSSPSPKNERRQTCGMEGDSASWLSALTIHQFNKTHARAHAHTYWVKRRPSSAILSKFGVRIVGWPYVDRSPHPTVHCTTKGSMLLL